MRSAFLSRLFSESSGGSADVVLGYEGIGWGWAFFFFVLLAPAIWWFYRWGAPALSRGQRGILTGLRLLLTAVFLILLVKPVLLLTKNEPVRERLIVLVDDSQSMEIKDRRTSNEDLNRAAIAAGLIPPAPSITGTPPSGIEAWQNVSRADLLRALATNDKLSLWSRLQEKADLDFYSFGREVNKLGLLGETVTGTGAEGYFQSLKFEKDVTAIGDSLRQVLEENRGQPVSGILILSDGANNSGTPPEEAAESAKQDGIPVFLYGVGITGPSDIIVREVLGPRGAFVKERAEFTVQVASPGFTGRSVKILLKADGKVVDKQTVKLGGDDGTEYVLGFEPQEKGEVAIETVIEPLDGEAEAANNSASTKVRVLDSLVKVLYIEQEPRWDFRYLLSSLQRDKRLSVRCLLIDGGPELAEEPDSPFLKEFPKDRAKLISNEIIILGDVDPKALGDENMALIKEWVGELGGGLIFLAGPKNNPFHFAGTPLEPLLPVELDPNLQAEQQSLRSREPIPLKLTALGDYSPLLRLSDNNLENRQIWNSFPGVRWTALVAGARPTAQILLVDPSPDRSARGEPLPVIAQQSYGQGAVMYFGFDETYRWRSEVGEKYYSKIWNQIILNFSLDRQLGASSRSQIRTDRPEYLVGDKVFITGKLFNQSFAPLLELTVPGNLVFKGLEEGAQEEIRELRLIQNPDQPGTYQAEVIATQPGEYRFSTLLDPGGILKFRAVQPRRELTETALDASLLEAMAGISGGKFLREENLKELPDLISSRSATIPTFKKFELYYSAWWMAVLIILACTEWFLRKLWQLK